MDGGSFLGRPYGVGLTEAKEEVKERGEKAYTGPGSLAANENNFIRILNKDDPNSFNSGIMWLADQLKEAHKAHYQGTFDEKLLFDPIIIIGSKAFAAINPGKAMNAKDPRNPLDRMVNHQLSKLTFASDVHLASENNFPPTVYLDYDGSQDLGSDAVLRDASNGNDIPGYPRGCRVQIKSKST